MQRLRMPPPAAPSLDAVSPGADAHEVLEVMKEARVRRMTVTEGGRLVGVIAQADLEVEKVLERIPEPVPAAMRA